MRIAMGYRWGQTSAGYHLERAFTDLGHDVQYVGLSSATRPGYDSSVVLPRLIDALKEQPDLYLWVDSAGRYFPFGIEEVSVPTACYIIDVHLGKWRYEVAKFFDVVFIAQKDYLDRFKQVLGHDQVYWLPLAAAADFHRQQDFARIYDVGFVGNISVAHRSGPRTRQLKRIASTFRTNDFYRFYPPQEVGLVYSQSKIVFNTSIAGDVTMRVFEGSMGGALVITDSNKNGLSELFHIGNEIILYGNDSELIAKIEYYLAHDQERMRIAGEGQRKTLGNHTYHHRVDNIVQQVMDSPIKQVAPMRHAPVQERAASRHIIYTHLHMVDTILDIAQKQDIGPIGRFVSVLPAFGRRLII